VCTGSSGAIQPPARRKVASSAAPQASYDTTARQSRHSRSSGASRGRADVEREGGAAYAADGSRFRSLATRWSAPALPWSRVKSWRAASTGTSGKPSIPVWPRCRRPTTRAMTPDLEMLGALSCRGERLAATWRSSPRTRFDLSSAGRSTGTSSAAESVRTCATDSGCRPWMPSAVFALWHERYQDRLRPLDFEGLGTPRAVRAGA